MKGKPRLSEKSPVAFQMLNTSSHAKVKSQSLLTLKSLFPRRKLSCKLSHQSDNTVIKEITCKKHLQSQQTILFTGPAGLIAAYILMSTLTFLKEQQEYDSRDKILKPGI